MKYREDPTEVDLFNLHIEWRDQAKLRREAGEELAVVSDTIRDKKTYIKHRKSQISREYRTGHLFEMTEGDKPVKLKLTEGALADVIGCNEELLELEKELNILLKDQDICTNYCTALDQKKYALQEEVRLYLASYFAEPTDTSRKSGDYQREMVELKTKQEESDDRASTRKKRERKNE